MDRLTAGSQDCPKCTENDGVMTLLERETSTRKAGKNRNKMFPSLTCHLYTWKMPFPGNPPVVYNENIKIKGWLINCLS